MFNLKAGELVQYKFEKIIVQITQANTGSLIEASTKSSFEAGNQMKTGSFKSFFHNSIKPLILTHHHTQTAHSGNIQSFHTLFNSCLTKYNISSYLAVTIFER